ncbi:MAG: hypothetical protein WC047_04445 [Kiritimatiellales bacterium]
MAKEHTKEERISRELKRLNKIYNDLDKNEKSVIEGLIRRAAYMRITLEDYEKDLDEGGYVEQFCQSEKMDPYDRERPVARLYNSMNKNYQSIMKQLADALPASATPGAGKGILEYVNGVK